MKVVLVVGGILIGASIVVWLLFCLVVWLLVRKNPWI